jgi:GDP-L-fucose synthase
MHTDSKILVADHGEFVGSAIVSYLRVNGYTNLVLCSREETDLTSKQAVDRLFECKRPEYVFLATARPCDILVNGARPADFLYENLSIELNVVDAAYRFGTKKLQFLGSSCIYPKYAPQPIREEFLLTGPLEPTNEWYAVAKIAGIKLCQAYRQQHGFGAICVMPTNLYGPGSYFEPSSSNLMSSLISKIHQAKIQEQEEIVLQGTGTRHCEFLHIDDLASAALFLMSVYDDQGVINAGSGEDIAISDLAALVQRIVGYEGRILFDGFTPDGVSRKLDSTRLRNLGWQPEISLPEGIYSTYRWYLEQPQDQAAQKIDSGMVLQA